MNPNGADPVLQDQDGEPLWETGAILRYLASRYADDAFWPRDVIRRAQVDKWAEWAKINIALNFTSPIFWQVVRTAPKDRNQIALREALRLLGKQFDIAEAQIADRQFLAGDDFSLADIQFGHVLYRYFDMPIERPSHPNLRRYYDALTARPAFQEHVMVSYEELRVVSARRSRSSSHGRTGPICPTAPRPAPRRAPP